jgi:hypothetical protein
VLPDDVPPSFACEGRKGAASVVYELRAKCAVAGMLDVGDSRDLHTGHAFTVYPSFHHATSSTRRGLLRQIDVFMPWWTGSGNVHINAQANKVCYYPGDLAEIDIEINNWSGTDFKQLKLSLVRLLGVSNATEHGQLIDELAAEEYPGVPSRAVRTGSSELHLTLQLPHRLASSMSGHIIDCSYAIAVTLVPKAMGKSVCLQVPVSIFAVEEPHSEDTAAPQEWHPSQFATTRIEILSESNDGLYAAAPFSDVSPLLDGEHSAPPLC